MQHFGMAQGSMVLSQSATPHHSATLEAFSAGRAGRWTLDAESMTRKGTGAKRRDRRGTVAPLSTASPVWFEILLASRARVG